MVIYGNLAEVEAEELEGSFHLSIVRTFQKIPKFKSLFNQLGFGLEAIRIATESLMSIATDSGVECFTVKSHTNWAYLETTNAITFTKEDMEVEYQEHCRPFYFMVP